MNEIIAFINEVPGAAKAVIKLVGSVATVGSSWLDIATAKAEQKSTEIRVVTDARAKVRNAMANALIKQVESGQSLGQRALEHFADEIVASQSNRENVTRLALEYLRDDPPHEKPAEEISDDWLNVFSIYAERASSDLIRQHWAAILAGEIRRPGSISLATLQLMSTIDVDYARVIQKYKNYVLIDTDGGKIIPLAGEFSNAPLYDDLLALDSINFLSLGNHSAHAYVYTLGKFHFKRESAQEITIGCGVLTKAGGELVDKLGQNVTREDVVFLREQINSSFG